MTANDVSLAKVMQLMVERDHFRDVHLDEDGARCPVYSCPNSICRTWMLWVRESGWMG